MSAPIFLLDINTSPRDRAATLRLSLHRGPFIAAHEVSLPAHPAAQWHAVFDTRRHVRTHERVTPVAAQLAELGAFLGREVLGAPIASALADGQYARTLLVRVSEAPDDALAPAFARVPWELAIAPGSTETLALRNVAVRVALRGAEPTGEQAIALNLGEPVRVLLVFADAPDQRPLAARLERERLLDLFFDEVMPTRNVEVDVLCHGVTRGRIEQQVKAKGGYHLVHWSGHGHVNHLELAAEEGEPPSISGEEMVRLLASAGGFIPPVFFLGACHSGAMVAVKDWVSLRASLGQEGSRESQDPSLDRVLQEPPGFAGTALSLVRAGVKQVVAMRCEVGDAYARRLARRVYRKMFADEAFHAVDTAVALARKELQTGKRAAQHDPVDHATPLVLGSESVRLDPVKKKSAQAAKREPRPRPLAASQDLDRPIGFVGRGEELTRLRREWLEGRETPIALLQGLAGLGKTSLAAEVVSLWFGRFDHVIAFQAKGGPLTAEDFLSRLDQRLVMMVDAYQATRALGRVYVGPATAGLSQEAREELLCNNLIDMLASERVLLVLDNFETNLLPSGACADPLWDRLFKTLIERLGRTQSRVLITSRHKPKVLENKALWIPLGPLPIKEAVLFFQNHAPLQELLSKNEEALALAKRILSVSRGHPLILNRIADLARGFYDKTHGLTPAGFQAIGAALDKIQGSGYQTLPDLFAGVKSDKDRKAEHTYLHEVAVGAVDLLIDRMSLEAQTVLWIATRVSEPPMALMVEAVRGCNAGQELTELCNSGLLVEQGDGTYAAHELVAERAKAWRDKHSWDLDGRTEIEIWKAYGEMYGALFDMLLRSGKRVAALEMGRRGIRYLVRARAFESLGYVASAMITSTRDPSLLAPVIADLQAVATEVPAGQARWTLRANLANALRLAGRLDQALPFFALAAEEAQAAEHWSDVGWICQNWAGALVPAGQLDRARETFLRSAEAERRAGRPRVNIAGSELEALRTDVMAGRAEDALPAIEARITEVRGYHKRQARGEPVPEAPDGEDLARTLVSGLDIAMQANHALERWQVCLDLLGEIEAVDRSLGASEHELAITRFNTYGPLLKLGKLAEAKAVLEACRDLFHRADDVTMEARTLSALADVWDSLGDPGQAAAVERRALALRDRLPNPGDRAISHGNLAIYLHTTSSATEAVAHSLASLAYTLTAGLDPLPALRIIAYLTQKSAARGERYDLPRLADLLTQPAFAPLRDFLAERAVAPDDLQAVIDDLLDQLRAALAASP